MAGKHRSYLFSVILEQIDDPDGYKRTHLLRCTRRKAKSMIGKIDKHDPNLRVIDMREV